MVKAFVFGKFQPFHKGHEAMINFALSKCDFLTALICCSDQEPISGTIRKSWIEKTFTGRDNLEVSIYNYRESELPNTSVSSKDVSKAWAGVFKKQFPDYSLLITSEEYGNFVAYFMRIQHIAFDIPKKLFPVSATAVRNDLFINWQFLPDSVKPFFAIKVVILGTESTGKTTLTENLSKHFNCSKVLETAREIVTNSNSFSITDLHLVANEHTKQIDKAVLGKSPLLIIDTNIFTTKSYCRFVFQKELEVSNDIEHLSRANLYLYLTNEVEYFQDGTRLGKTERDLLDNSHRAVLAENNIKFVEISGNWNARFVRAVDEINKAVKKMQ